MTKSTNWQYLGDIEQHQQGAHPGDIKMKETELAIAQIRAFNRFYTDLIGLLNKHLLDSDYSLAEARILYEIHAGQRMQASQIMIAMHIDKSYLSRLLKKLEKEKLIANQPSPQDARASLLSLTEKGQQLFAALNRASDQQIAQLVGALPLQKQQELVGHMQSIMHLLDK